MATQIERTACQMLSDNLGWLVLPGARQYVEQIVADEDFAEFPGEWYDAAIDQNWNPADYSVPAGGARLYRGMVEAYGVLAGAVAGYRRNGRPLDDASRASDPQADYSMISSLGDEVARCHSLVAQAFAQELPFAGTAASGGREG